MIELKNITKSYKTPQGRQYIFKNVSLKFPENKSVALVGRNGAGKSTLLRIIGGIDKPDDGEVVTDKKISWPVGLAGGFQGSLTGRENVKFVANLYAKKKDVRDVLNFVEDFAELGKYFDMPIRTYSSGMRSRLGFGLSMAFKFDYYLVDEVTAVGDEKFKNKCSAMFKERGKGANFLMVSHNFFTLVEHCDVAIYLNRENQVLYFDKVMDAIKKYRFDEFGIQ
ncbi:ABC transporter ATP-binding protein [Pluralibacter sp.]|uniref:ABC transporter ATP-binding protein n=1 Tax=Pluralibacter sp. TaxID=1920032 RepID=UPI0025F11B25|nr:ABC transporter ATP-binding protein [Pluralibacter sp.]MBV8045051.1 ABC transporter ATP-binding protein [Pluralibacter sp.]